MLGLVQRDGIDVGWPDNPGVENYPIQRAFDPRRQGRDVRLNRHVAAFDGQAVRPRERLECRLPPVIADCGNDPPSGVEPGLNQTQPNAGRGPDDKTGRSAHVAGAARMLVRLGRIRPGPELVRSLGSR